MRTSSIKSLAATVALAIALTLAAPLADARPRSREPRSPRAEAIVRTLIDFLKRMGGLTTNAGPSVPINDPQTVEPIDPVIGTGTNTDTGTERGQ